MKKLLLMLVLIPFYAFAEPVNINQADAETLSRALNGIGPKKAEAIVQYRKDHGEFKTLKDLENVSGIGEKTIQLNEKDILFADGPATPPVGVVEKPSEPAPKGDAGKKAK